MSQFLSGTGSDPPLSPPRAPLAFRVGVVGHRPNRLAHANLDALRIVLRSLLIAVKEEVESAQRESPGLYAEGTPVLRAVSPLAEGTDRLFAEQALDLDYELCCVMPFAQADFERDFEPGNSLEDDSVGRFRSILNRARREKGLKQFELDGSRSDSPAAYGVAGRVVMNQSDLLVVICERHEKRGGTEETLDEARGRGVPVVWIDARAPHAWQLLITASPVAQPELGTRATPDGSGNSEVVRDWVRAALDLPKDSGHRQHSTNTDEILTDEERRRRLDSFYCERRPRFKIALAWTIFRDIVGDRKWPQVQFYIPPFEKAVEDEWPQDRSSPIATLVNDLRSFYAWPDKLAVLYSDRYRSAYVLAFLLAAIAVGMALLPIGASLSPHQTGEIFSITVELACIIMILMLIWRGQRGKWHQRWIAYRLLAELVRHVRLVAPLGGERPFPQVPAHWATYGQPGASWMAWYVRALERMAGTPTVVVDNTYLQASLDHLRSLLDGQARWHDANAQRAYHIQHRLHFSGIALLVVTLIAGALHLLPSLWHTVTYPEWLPPVLTFVCGFFPALGAAMAG